MGRSKSKKTKQASDAAQSPVLDGAEIKSSESVRAIDGHNTKGWSNNEIKAYNELVQERQKLEKQRHELEEKCAKSQTQRALLHENVANIDSLFKQQKSMSSAYKFTGQSDCCVEIDASGACHHEVCKRAKTAGVSDVELDTIKYYSLRIHSEKSERMRNALRKQRDIELIRVKKEEDEGPVQNLRKTSKKSKTNYADNRNLLSKDMNRAAKETERIVNKIIHQLDDLRSDLQTGKISAEEAQGKLNILDTKLPAIQDKSNKSLGLLGNGVNMDADEIQETTEIFQGHLRDRLLNAQGDTFSQAFSIMDHFLSATKPDDLQAAISELKEVLQLSGPMCDDLQNSFGALEGIFDNPDKLSFSGPDGKQECTSMIDLMDKLKDTLKRTGQLPDGANASLTKTFQECIDLETEAKNKMMTKCNDNSIRSSDMPAVLLQIKNEFVTKSPIPPLTSNKLAMDITNLLDEYDVKQLLASASMESKPNVLEAQITSLVISRTQKKPEKFVDKLERFEVACTSAGGQGGSVVLKEAISNVMVKMKKWVPAPESKKENRPEPMEKPKSNSSPSQVPNQSTQANATTKTSGLGRADVSPQSTSGTVPSSHQAGSETRDALVAAIRKYGKFGFWRTFQMHCHETSFSTHPPLLEKVKSYKEKARTMIEDQAYGMKASICYLFKLKLCPGAVAAIMSQALVDIAQGSEDDCRLHFRELSTCIDSLPYPIPAGWSATFRHIVLAMIQLYVAVHIESMVLFPELSALCLALSTVETFTNFILMSKTTQMACNNIHEMVSYLLTCFGQAPSATVPLLEAPFFHYRYFCFSDGFKCTTAGSCTKHMSFTRIPFNIGLGHVSHGAEHTKGVQRIEQPYLLDKGIVEEASQVTSTSNLELEPHVSEPMQNIKPMKSVVSYPSGHPGPRLQQQDDLRKQRRKAQYAECLKRATVLYDATARRARDIAEFRTDVNNNQKILPPAELLAAMDDILISAGNDHYRPIDGTYRPSLTLNNNMSKFSEHLDEPQRSTYLAIGGALNIQHTFKKMQTGIISGHYLDRIGQSMVERALSGRYPNPIEAIGIYAESLTRLCRIPDCFEDALAKAQHDVETILEDPKSYQACETRRLRYLLTMAHADEPSIATLVDLAVKHPSAFDEYHQIVADKLEDIDAKKVELLECSFSDVVELAQNAQLNDKSASMVTFFRLALEDWSARDQQALEDDSTLNDPTLFDQQVHDSDDVTVDRSAMRYNGSPTIVESPARLPMLQKQSSARIPIAAQASISPSHETSTFTSTQTSVPYNGQELEDAIDRVMSSAPYLKGFTAHLKKVPENGNENSSSDVSIDKPQYLLSTDHAVSEEDASEGSNEPSTPAAFRMLDMTKRLAIMQKNSKEVSEGAEEMMKLSKEHGQVLTGVAEKLAKQAEICASIIAVIGDYHGIEVAQEGCTPTPFKKKQ